MNLGGGLDDPRFGKDEIDKIHFGPDLIWERESEKPDYGEYTPGKIIFYFVRTDTVNLRDILNWNIDDSEAQKYPQTGIIDWRDGTKTYFNNPQYKEEKLYHEYDRSKKWQVAIEGVFKLNYDRYDFGRQLEKIEIPEGETSPIYYIVHNAFQNYEELTEINGNLFDNCTEVTDFSLCFKGCTRLKTIPSYLFSNCIQATNFNECFYNCYRIIEFNNTFNGCVNAKMFNRCFALSLDNQYKNATTQFINVFANCINANVFSECFLYCGLEAPIQNNLFYDCINANNFSNCFNNTALKEIPKNLFDNNKEVTNFEMTFNNCRYIQGELPLLWISHSEALHSQCFYNCKDADNYAEAIEAGWA